MGNKKKIQKKIDKLQKRYSFEVYIDFGSEPGSKSIEIVLLQDMVDKCWCLMGEYQELINENKFYYHIKTLVPEEWPEVKSVLSVLPKEYRDQFSQLVIHGFSLQDALKTLQETYKF
jgi:hypothetical protein